MDVPGTIFYLVPINKYATWIVEDLANSSRRCTIPDISPVPILRIGLDQHLKSPPYLASFGRRDHNDVILHDRFSRNDQCYFDFNKATGELLLHDLSQKKDTELYDTAYDVRNGKEVLGPPQIWKTDRQCVVLLTRDPLRDPNDGRGPDRKWFFQMRDAEFLLIPRRTQGDQSEAAFAGERLAFAAQPDPERTVEGTMQRLLTLALQSEGRPTREPTSIASFNPHNTRFQTTLEQDDDDEIVSTKLQRLGQGGQGQVYKVVDMHNGKHYACKVVAVKAEIPEWGIYSERAFRARVEAEVRMVQGLKHDHIVPYEHTQGFKIGQDIEIFMPVYEGSLHALIQRLRDEAPEMVLAKISAMLFQMLDALDFVHTRDPPIIHRDIKPPNILYRGDEFFLTDFGIAKVVDTSNTVVGTEWYMAPEVRENGEQTPKVDIWGLGVTVVECLVELPSEKERKRLFKNWPHWYEDLQVRLTQHELRFASMLAVNADRRPTARDLLNAFQQSTDAPLQNPPTNVTLASFGVSSLANQANGTTTIYSAVPTPMDWTQTVVTAFFRGNPQSTQRNESMQPPQPNPVAIQSPIVPPSRLAQGARRGGSVKSAKSTDERQKKRHRRNGSSQDGRRAPSQSAGVPKRTSGGKRRPRSKSMHKAQEIQALGMA